MRSAIMTLWPLFFVTKESECVSQNAQCYYTTHREMQAMHASMLKLIHAPYLAYYVYSTCMCSKIHSAFSCIYTSTHTSGSFRAVEVILKSHPEHVNVREQQGCTPLHIAATEGELEVARTLLRTVIIMTLHVDAGMHDA